MDAFDDEAHHRLWRVVDSSNFADVRVIGCEERFIEMDRYGIVASRGTPKFARIAFMFPLASSAAKSSTAQ